MTLVDYVFTVIALYKLVFCNSLDPVMLLHPAPISPFASESLNGLLAPGPPLARNFDSGYIIDSLIVSSSHSSFPQHLLMTRLSLSTMAQIRSAPTSGKFEYAMKISLPHLS